MNLNFNPFVENLDQARTFKNSRKYRLSGCVLTYKTQNIFATIATGKAIRLIVF